MRCMLWTCFDMARTACFEALQGMLLALLLLQSSQLTRSTPPEPDREPPTQTVRKLYYPLVKVGPYNWQYFRVPVPHGFQRLRIELTKLWRSEKFNKQGLLNPLICFRLGAPPSPAAALPSVEQAAIAAGLPESVPKIGHCALFSNTTTVNLDNEQVIAGEWHVGVFSNSQPTRFQSKMISRGPVYTFGLRLSIFGCGSPTLTGKHCNLTVSQICSGDREFDVVNIHATGAHAATTHFLHKSGSPNIETPTVSADHGDWNILINQNFGATQWKYYSLHIREFATSLMVQVEQSNFSGDAQRSLSLFVRFGALPRETNFSVNYIQAAVPNRGWWYIGVFNSAEPSRDQSFSLLWRLQSWARDEPKRALFQLKRSLQEDVFESPFDSFFTLSDKTSESSPSEWFPFKPSATLNSDPKSEHWSYFTFQIPQGVAGATLTVEIRNIPISGAELYIRHEGLPTLVHHNVHIKSNYAVLKHEFNHSSAKGHVTQDEREVSGLQNAGDGVALNMMFPLEGTWCIGVRAVNGELLLQRHLVSQNDAVGQVNSLSPLTPKSAPYVERISRWLRMKARYRMIGGQLTEFNNSLFKVGVSAEGRNVTTPYPVQSYDFQELDAIGRVAYQGSGHEFERNEANEKLELVDVILSKNVELDHQAGDLFPQMRVQIHGCLNYCSGHGSCQTTYDSSHLYQYSYCHCDNTHGGDDCSVILLPANEEMIHIWALVGSNFAAIMPSLWAIRHNAYAEWVTYTISGLASGVYHSCDAGGWCALSYDTLQFLDFWLSLLAVAVTCLYIASLEDATKAIAQTGSAIVTAAVTKENATSAWNVLLVVLMSSVGLILGWALESRHSHLLPTWAHSLAPFQSSFGTLAVFYNHLEEFMRMMKKRFHWIHLFSGLGILVMAGLSWIMETDDTYWIWHSLWHVSIYTSAFVTLSSSCATKTWALPPTSEDEWLRRNDEDDCRSTALHEFETGSESGGEQAVNDHHHQESLNKIVVQPLETLYL